LLVASTARERGASRHYHTPDALRMQLAQQQEAAGTVGVVFGREASGLTNDELALCDLWSSVPLAQEYPSLNLGQAVMVYTYALSNLAPLLGLREEAADAGQLAHLLQRVQQVLAQDIPDCDLKIVEWLAERLPLLGDRDVKMAHQLLNRLTKP
jgi:tRNA/rRNA methyltransferase